ncbi:LysR family transcriptional regulator [Peribacillus butanolivorans]|uniref:LysR family transcriptional regulator n=1 Tax=Peribacillus butanolivorans TaxID=421767 RepID=A0AAX0S503_9BACI|nr:LysR substrate-binding domain-containing protein [Peribacillus butanolivorans]PEJ34340.1 LysR family transcriptional regulator [Peribacillus butanolivorans]
MDLLQMRYFQIVAKHQHLTKAAEALNITQPALSKMISKLENSLGYELFDRRGRQIQLNKLGESYLRTVEQVFLQLKEGEKELAYLADKQDKLISIAVTIPSILPELLGGFLKKHPNARFRQHQASFERIKKQIEIGEIDVGISTVPVIGEHIEWVPILEEEIFLAVPLSHPLANRKSIYLKEVENAPFIVMPLGYDFRDMTERFCREAGFYPDFAFEGDETGITHELVEKGLGVALFPSLLSNERLHDLQTAKLKIIEPHCSRTVGLVWHKSRPCNDIVKSFIQYTMEFLEDKKDQERKNGF